MKDSKTKTLFLAIVFMICGFVFGACANTAIADQIHPLKIWKENRNGQNCKNCFKNSKQQKTEIRIQYQQKRNVKTVKYFA